MGLLDDALEMKHIEKLWELTRAEPLTPEQRRRRLLARILHTCFADGNFGESVHRDLMETLLMDPGEAERSEDILRLAETLNLPVELLLEMWSAWLSRLHENRQIDLLSARLLGEESSPDSEASEVPWISTPELEGPGLEEFGLPAAPVPPLPKESARRIFEDAVRAGMHCSHWIEISCGGTVAAHPVIAMGLAKHYCDELSQSIVEAEKRMRKLYNMPTRHSRQIAFADDQVRAFYLVHLRGRSGQDSDVYEPFSDSTKQVTARQRLNAEAVRKVTRAVNGIRSAIGLGARPYHRKRSEREANAASI